MPKPMLRTQQHLKSQGSNILSANQQESQTQQTHKMDKMKLDRILRKNRSREYMDALHKLDAGGHVQNRKLVQEIINAIKREFPEVELSGILLGYVSICYLGKPYEVHTLDMTEKIIEHFKSGQLLPNGMEKARGIAIRGGYDFIEVYADCVRAVSSNGMVSVISC